MLQYSNGLMMFGGKDASGAITTLILYSRDYGLTWKDADAEMEISSLYVSRYGISAVVNDDMIIYLIGGKSGSAFVNDVWSGYQYSQLPGFKN